MWGILNTLNSSDVDEVTIDSGANWKATKITNNTGIKVSIYPSRVQNYYGLLCGFVRGLNHIKQNSIRCLQCFLWLQQEEDSSDGSLGKRSKAVSPGSMNMPTMNNWDMNQALSPYLPPDMNTIASGSMISSYNQNGQNRNSSSNNQNYDFGMTNGPGSNEFAGNGPLSHLNDSVNSLDPLNAMEKSLNDQVCNKVERFDNKTCLAIIYLLSRP